MPVSHTDPDDIALAERRAEALDLRTQGLSFRAIGSMLGVSHTSAKKYVDHALDELAQQTRAGAARLRAQEVDRLVWVIRSMRDAVNDGSTQAAQVVIASSARIAKLYGLDAPEKLDVATTMTSRSALARLPDDELLALDEQLNGAENRDEEPAETA